MFTVISLFSKQVWRSMSAPNKAFSETTDQESHWDRHWATQSVGKYTDL